MFPISRDPPEGGTINGKTMYWNYSKFPISRDPPEGGTLSIKTKKRTASSVRCFQFLGIPPKGELIRAYKLLPMKDSFQFLGIPPKGELEIRSGIHFPSM